MPVMTLHAQADLWSHGGGVTFAALFMEGEMRSPDNAVERTDVLVSAVLNRGLRLATDLPRLALGPRPGWAIRLDPAGALTLSWPHTQPLLLDAPLNLPDGWPEAAAQHGLVLLFVGDSLGLRDHAESAPTNPGRRAPQAAQRGELAAGAITYSGTYSGQRHNHAPNTRPLSSPLAEFTDRPVLLGGNFTRHSKHSASTSEAMTSFSGRPRHLT